MKNFVYLCLVVCILSIKSVVAGVGDTVTTSEEFVGQIHITGGTYYFQTKDGNWSVPECPNARYVYMKESDSGVKAMLSVALTAKSSNKPIKFVGTCGDTNGSDIYIQGKTIIFL